LRQLSRQLLRLDGSCLGQPRDRRALPPDLPGSFARGYCPRRLRDGALARHHSPRYRHGTLARRLGGVGVRASPFAIALRSIQREAITADPAWAGGDYPPERPPATGLRIARKLGTVTYRSAAELQQRFGREPIRADLREGNPFASEFAVQGYLESLAQRFVNAFDANCYLYISRAIDRFDLGAHGEAAALFRRARLAEALVIGVESDLLFPVHEQQAVAERLEAGGIKTSFVPLPCIQGHDSFLIDLDTFGRRIGAFLRSS
jgi:homoserine O-acetyltransferase/O-succinyltransferase